MHVLVRGLPPESLVRTAPDDRHRDAWTGYHELLAQIIEVVSIGAANHALKKPIKVKRPGEAARKAAGREVRAASEQPGDNPYSRAIAALGGAQPSRKRELLAAPIEEHDEDEGDGTA